MNKVRVGINGYGVIGKRIADAVKLQDDMELVGVTARTPDFRLFSALKKDLGIFAVDQEAREKLESGGFEVMGTLDDLLSQVEIIIDATPAGVGEENKEKYDKAGVKSIFQGGEEHQLTNFSFPSHQGPDARTVIPNLDILTVALAVPTTLGHLHLVELMRDLGRPRADMWEVAIRAVGGTEEDPQASIGKTNNSLGIVSAFNV